MFKFGSASRTRLNTVDSRLQRLFEEVIKHVDCTIVSGSRTTQEQQILFAQGRTMPGEIVTTLDGIERRSKHQSGMAVDVVPYPSMYDCKDEILMFAGFVKGVASQMEIDIVWGGDWRNFCDSPHYEVVI